MQSFGKKMTACALYAGLAASFLLTGCGGPSYGEELYRARVELIGDAPKDSALLNLIKIGELGAYTFALQTDTAPYGLTVHFSEEPEDGNALDQIMEKKACLLFALIDDLADVSWTYPMDGKTVIKEYSFEMATNRLGEKVDTFGQSAKDVERLAEILGETE